MSRILLLLALCAAAQAGPRTVPEAPTDTNAAFLKEKVETLYQEGLELYQAERFREALPKFEAAYALFADPALLYNIGRCHEGLGEPDFALTRYTALIADPAAAPEVRAKAETRKQAIETHRALPPPVIAPPPVAAVLPEPDPTPWIVIGAGAAALAAGGVFITLGIGDHTELERAEQGKGREISDKKKRELDEGGSTKKTAGGALLGLGATAVGLGIYLLVKEDAPVMPTAGLGGLGLTGRF